MTVWAYYRVSTDKQDYESQKIGVVEYAKRANLNIDHEIIDDGISGVVLAKDRKLGKLVRQLQAGDMLIVSELSRLGRSTADVINTCNTIAKHKADCYMVKQNMRIDQSPVGKLMIAIFSAFAEMERDLISQRTKEAMQRRKQKGLKLGRQFGAKNIHHCLDGKIDKLKELWESGISARQIADKLNVASTTINVFVNQHKDMFPRREKVIAINSKDGKATKAGCSYWLKKDKQ